MLSQRSFLPLFSVQFLGALNDNIFKNAMVMWITFRLTETGEEAGLMVTAAAGLFILPFLLFSALAGQVADRFSKTVLIRKIKLFEMFLMLTGAWAFWTESVTLLFIVLFLMGAQSAFFGPIKYSILPEVLKKAQLAQGNAWFSGSTFIAILLGTILGGWAILQPEGTQWVALIIMGVALAGYVASLLIPLTSQENEAVNIEANFIGSTWRQVKLARTYPVAWQAVLGISWFWFLGAVYLSQIPILVKDVLAVDESWVLIFLTLFSIGIALGSALAAWQMRAKVVSKLHDLQGSVYWLASISVVILGGHLSLGLGPEAVAVGLFLIALLGGRYIVPLYTLMQTATASHFRARIVATNNILNSLLMVLSSVLLMLGYALEMALPQMLLVVALINLMVAWQWQNRNKRG